MVYALAFLSFVSLFFGVLAIITIWRGYVLSIVWGWLVVPMFGLAPITTLGAIIIAMVVGYLTYQHSNCKKSDDHNEMVSTLSIGFVYPLLVLVIAWVVKAFI